MDREKMLKKWQIITIIEWLFSSVWYFITIYYIAYKPEVRYNFVNIFMWYVLLIALVVILRKIKPEKRRVMPMIISIHDTVEKLKKQRITLIVIQFILIVFNYIVIDIGNIILMAISSTWIVFAFCANLIKDKIEYIKEKPEGL